ncbi:hypothetical protein HN51_035930 [Arachis hypogaea]
MAAGESSDKNIDHQIADSVPRVRDLQLRQGRHLVVFKVTSVILADSGISLGAVSFRHYLHPHCLRLQEIQSALSRPPLLLPCSSSFIAAEPPPPPSRRQDPHYAPRPIPHHHHLS